MLLLLQICFCFAFVMRETLCCLCLTIIKLILLRLLTPPPDILDDLLNIDNPYFEQMVGQIYPTELQLNKANSSDTEAPFLDLNLSITNGMVSSKIYDKRDDFNFEIVKGYVHLGAVCPPREPKTESCFSPISSYWFISPSVKIWHLFYFYWLLW